MHSWPRQELAVWAHPEDGLWQWAGKQAPGLAREPSCSVVEWLSIAHIAPSSLSYKKAADGLVRPIAEITKMRKTNHMKRWLQTLHT